MFARLTTCGLLMALGLATVSGCGPAGPPPTAKASGTVTTGGQPVKAGEIYFVASDKGFSATGSLDASGKYAIKESLPPATYKVFVTRPRITAPPMPGTAAPTVSSDFNVPDKYQTETTSGLTAEVKPGDNTFDFKLD